MSGSDRGEQPKAVVGLGLVAALAICCLIVGVLSYSQGRETERRYQSPHQHGEWAKQSAQKACANRNTSDAADCIYERVKSAEEQGRAEEDLSAQQRAATSALVAAIIGGITLLISGVGLWALLETIGQGRAGLERAAEANAIAADTASQQLRPYLNFAPVDVEPGLFEISGPQKFAFKNYGQTPAREVEIHYCYDVFKRPIGSAGLTQYRPLERYGEVAPGQIVDDSIALNFTTAEVERIMAGDAVLLRISIYYKWLPNGSDCLDVTFALKNEGLGKWSFSQISNEERQWDGKPKHIPSAS